MGCLSGGALVILRGCTCLKCTNQVECAQGGTCHPQGVHLSQVHQPSRMCYVGALLALLVQLRQLHPLEVSFRLQSYAFVTASQKDFP